jgi:hypothetical protein
MRGKSPFLRTTLMKKGFEDDEPAERPEGNCKAARLASITFVLSAESVTPDGLAKRFVRAAKADRSSM